MQNKETEVSHKKADVEKQLEVVESEKVALRQQLKLAQTRIESLQAALKGEDSEEEEEMTSFLDHHRRAMSVQRDRRSMTRELRSDAKYFLDAANIFGKSWIRDIFGRIMNNEILFCSVGRELRSASMSRDMTRATSLTRDAHVPRASMPRDTGAAPRDARDIRSMSRDIRASVAKEFSAATRDYLTTRAEDAKDTAAATPTVVKET